MKPLLALSCLLALGSFLASPQSGPPHRSNSGTAGSRPAAAGQPRFADVARRAGLNLPLTCGSPEKRYVMESLCGGVAIFDYDNDGWLDILLVDGSTLLGGAGETRLYRNQHDGTFRDVTATAGPFHRGWGFGVAVGDYDNDGWEDLYITYLDGGHLYHNEHGHFVDATAKAGVDDGGHWGTSAAFGDYDHDGKLDLYVANYVDLDRAHLPEFGKGMFCQYRSIPVSCGPRGLKGGRDRLYRNNGDGIFSDVTERLKIDAESSYGLGVIWADFTGDGCLDLYVSNDSSPSLLYRGDCKGGLEEIGIESGVAYSADGRLQAGMGVDAADYDNDGNLDLVKTNFSDDANNLYHNNGQGEFTDLAGPSGFGLISVPYLGFGVKFFDFDNDGWKDIFVANGHVNPQVDAYPLGITFAERNLLFHNRNGNFEEIGEQSGPAMQGKNVARGLASADLWNDGRTELVITRLGQPPALLAASGGPVGNWIGLKLVGTKSNRDGFGARVKLTAGGHVQMDEVRANSSYLSASDPRLHFGLGSAKAADHITIQWPSGMVDEIAAQPAGRLVTITEGKGVTQTSRPTPAASAPHRR